MQLLDFRRIELERLFIDTMSMLMICLLVASAPRDNVTSSSVVFSASWMQESGWPPARHNPTFVEYRVV